jgi:hypothetical protein
MKSSTPPQSYLPELLDCAICHLSESLDDAGTDFHWQLMSWKEIQDMG